jgi:hypothetical protein
VSRASRAAVLIAAAAAATFAFGAGSLGANFAVNISLQAPGGGAGPGSAICRSETLSEQTGALVRVACASGLFVSISPRPGGRFFGTHGGAHTLSFGPSFGVLEHSLGGVAGGGAGTIASFRVYSVGAGEGLIDMLVSF